LQELVSLGLAEPIVAQLRHGADYIMAAYNEQDGTLVSHVFDGSFSETSDEWKRPEMVQANERKVSFVNDGSSTEIYSIGEHISLKTV
jgi:hypothetical protein